jgi:hypothetical protein
MPLPRAEYTDAVFAFSWTWVMRMMANIGLVFAVSIGDWTGNGKFAANASIGDVVVFYCSRKKLNINHLQ